MKNLKRLSAAVVLTCVLGLSALAGEMNSPPCAPPEPGQVQTPPCAGQTTSDNSTLPGETSSPPSTNAGTEYLVAKAAISLFESWLSLF